MLVDDLQYPQEDLQSGTLLLAVGHGLLKVRARDPNMAGPKRYSRRNLCLFVSWAWPHYSMRDG